VTARPPGALARLQQALGLLAVLASVGAATVAWQHGRAGLAVLALAAVPALHAGVLALEFLLQAVLNRADPAPPPRPGERVGAWWREAIDAWLVFGLRQPWQSRAEPDHLPQVTDGRPGVLLVHGFLCNRGVWTPAMRQLRAEGIPFVAVNLEPVFGGIDDYAACLEVAAGRLARHTGRVPLVVAHSMGGLAVRAWLRAAGGSAAARIDHLVTLGTPHRGTLFAYAATSANVRQMRPSSPWLRALASEEPPDLAARTTCVFSSADNVVLPASNACLPGATPVFLAGVGHVGLAARPEVWRLVAARRAASMSGDNGAHAGMAQ
jgi:triacylglycerol lipase